MGPGDLRTLEGGVPVKSGGSKSEAAVKSEDSRSRTLERAAAVMPREKCFCRRSVVSVSEG